MTYKIKSGKRKIGLRSLNKLLKEKGASHNTEVTKHKGKYYLLHICKNNVPVPLYYSKDPKDILNQIKLKRY